MSARDGYCASATAIWYGVSLAGDFRRRRVVDPHRSDGETPPSVSTEAIRSAALHTNP